MATDQPQAADLSDNESRFTQLTSTPRISIPAVALFSLGVIIAFWSTTAAIAQTIPTLLAVFLNGFALYLFFSLLHEAIHDNVSTNKPTNELLGRVSIFFLIPFAPLEIARWIHLKHHAHTACTKDPDNFIHHGKWWVLPFRWANFDVFYTVYFVKAYFENETVAVRHAFAVVLYVIALATIVAGFILAGSGMELLLFWFIPSRIGLMLVGCIFVFLPHHPADISSHDDKYAATTIRQGWEWLLTPLMAFHNYHLIHHLFPQTPFYNHLKMWRLKNVEILANNPAMQPAFRLRPINR